METKSMKELCRIRKEHYEATKNMTLEERMEYDKKEYEKACKAFGMKPLSKDNDCGYDTNFINNPMMIAEKEDEYK